ncbi:hypothetical protein Tco_0822976 [Tanacetum coccineum]|uniref:Reverse transcriptase Ty1/copia-type domain-containing protein n=1 Tax=Tanacetum coccineum TaxID=301880 RepID=A0ABQ5AJL1_9ASTR
MDNPNITMEEYIKVDKDVHDLRSVEIEFPAIVFNDELSFEKTLSCEPTVSSLNNNEIDFRISFDESDDEDYMIVFDKNSLPYKIISVNDLKTDSENDNKKVDMPSFPSPEPKVSCFDDLDFFKDFENEFPAIVYNDALTSKSDLLTEPTLKPQHIDEFNLKDETSLSECDEAEQNVLYFNDLFPFNVIYHGDSKSDKDNDDDKIDIYQSLGESFAPVARLEAIRDFSSNLCSYELGVYQMDLKTAFLNGYPNEFSKVQWILTLSYSETVRDYFCPRGIFINQSKYALQSLKKYGFDSCDPVDTLMVEKSKLDEDKEGKAVDPSHYHGIVNQELWYPKDSSIALTAFTDADHVGCQDTRHSTSGSMQFLGDRLITWSSKRQKSVAISSMEAGYIALSGYCAQILWMRS